MNGYVREEARRDTCRNHSGRSDREPYRVCPSKLSKRELEDLYFTVLENNVELKKTINSQQERIKLLSTKVQRMTVTQRGGPGRDSDCCSYIKAMVNEQKQSIADLKKANENLSERIRVLNMRLCSAKQFLRRSPVASMSRCTKAPAVPLSVKNSSISFSNVKTSDGNVKSAGVSSQYLDKEVVLSTRTVETETGELEKENTEKLCDENKCRSQIAELKQKIVDLQEELSITHERYSLRISRLEEEVADLRVDKQREQTQRAADTRQLQQRGEQLDHLATRLCAAESQYAELAMELAMEKRKVAELETRVKAADMSATVAKTIQKHLDNTGQVKNEIENQQRDRKRMSFTCANTDPVPDSTKMSYLSPRDQSYSFKYDLPTDQSCSRKLAASTHPEPTEDVAQNQPSKYLDDSGFIAYSPEVDKYKYDLPNAQSCSRNLAACTHSEPTDHVAQNQPTKYLDESGFIAFSPEVDKYKSEAPVERKCQYMEAPEQVDQHRASKLSQDSGVVANSPNLEEAKEGRDVEAEIYNRMSFLQHQLEVLKSSALPDAPVPESEKLKSIISVDKQKSSSTASKALYFEPEASTSEKPRGPAPKVSVSSSAAVADSCSKMTLPKKKSVDTAEPQLSAEKRKVEVEHSALGLEQIKALQSVSVATDLDRNFTLDENTTHKMEKEAQEAYSRMSFRKRRTYGSNLEGLVVSAKGLRGDSHNSMQIPGPMPVDDATGSKKEMGLRQRQSLDKKIQHDKKDSNDSDISQCREVISLDKDSKQRLKVKSAFAQKTLADDPIGYGDTKEVPTSYRKEENNLILGEASSHAIRPAIKAGTSETVRSGGLDRRDNGTATSMSMFRAASPVSLSVKATDTDGMIKVVGPSVIGKFMEDDVSMVVPATGAGILPEERTAGMTLPDEEASGKRPTSEPTEDVSIPEVTMGAPPVVDIGGPFEFCSRYARLCACPRARRRDVSVFRTCSGSLRFRTVPAAAAPLRQCACPPQHETKYKRVYADSQTEEEQSSKGYDPRADSATYSKGAQTYSVPAGSPENTDCEISSMTDLPSERDGKSPRVLSPGEEKATTSTYTGTQTATTPTTTEYGTLSEGELPGAGEVRRTSRLSASEAKVNFQDARKMYSQTPRTQPQRMEDALAAISEELALCRDLLQARHPQKKASKDASLMVDLQPGPIALKRAQASPRIGDAFTPKCIFTLHIGTVVLSDEAVINSRSMSLVLMWKFYDQNVTMSRMKAGRVVLFDFSTEYDVKITDQFLDYMKHEEMQLVICEVNKQWEPFASCALRLRETLLHTNRRADMSLALVAGPQLRRARANRDDLDAGDEVGVLDLWCMLRVDPSLLPAVSRALQEPSPGCSGRRASLQAPGRRLSDDLDVHLKRPRRNPVYDYDRCPVPDNTSVASQTQPLPARAARDDIQANDRHLEKNNTPFHGPGQVGFKNDGDTCSTISKILVNEVCPKYRSPNEMKAAIDDNISSAHSTASSWRGLVTRRLVTKEGRSTSYINKNGEEKESRATLPSFFKYRGKQKRNSKTKGLPAPIMRSSVDMEEPPELNRSHRILNASKKSVTYTDEAYPPTKLSFDREPSDDQGQFMEITIQWLALNEECDAMTNPKVQRLYVAYAFLGRSGADLETPTSLPKPNSYVDKCFFHFSKTFQLNECDLPLLAHMAKCRSSRNTYHDTKDCVVFTVISEPPEDPLGLDSCVDIGYAYLYLGDLLEYSAGNDTYTEVIPVLSATAGEAVCGVLCVKVDGLDVLRQCSLSLTHHRASTTTRLPIKF